MKNLAFLFCTFFAFSGCQNADYEATEINLDAMPEQAGNPAVSEKGFSESTIRKIIKNGSITFKTDDLEETKQFIKSISVKYKAVLLSDNISSYGERRSNTIVLKLLPTKFDSVISEISGKFGKIENLNISNEDVTAEFIDLEARMKVKKELETQFIELLKKAKTVTETLEIERELSKIREEIESVEGRFKYLKSQIAYSTLNIEFYENIPEYLSLKGEFSRSLANGWVRFVSSLYFLLSVWPFVLIGLLLTWFVLKRK